MIKIICRKLILLPVLLLLPILCVIAAGRDAQAAEEPDYSLVFDAGYYASHHADVQAAFGNDSKALLAHFIKSGMKEGRQASAGFDVQTYRDRYPDLKKAFGNDLEKYYYHYMTKGYKEGRTAAAVAPAASAASVIPEQKITVKGTGGTKANLTFSEKDSKGTWRTLLTSKAYIGKNGFSANRREGDCTTPTGTYRFTMAFGIAADPGCALGYTQVDDNDYWCGDSSSPYYNRFVSADQAGNFNRAVSEHLINIKPQYQYCLNISFNEEQTPGRGSAIFLHCYGPDTSTHGCVAIPKADMRFILTHVNETCKVILGGSDVE